METMYDRIKKLRISYGWTQEQLAKKVGYADKTAIAKIESGKVDLPQSKIVAFSKALNATYSYLLDGEENSEKNSPPKYPPQLNSIISKAQQLNSEGLKELEKHADLLLLSEKYRKIEAKERAI